jgi:hypothetical protein
MGKMRCWSTDESNVYGIEDDGKEPDSAHVNLGSLMRSCMFLAALSLPVGLRLIVIRESNRHDPLYNHGDLHMITRLPG